MYQRSGQLKPKTLNLDPLRRKNKNNRNSNRSSSKASTQASKQASKQTNNLHATRCCEGGGDQNRDQNKGGNTSGLFEQGESWISVFFFKKKITGGISPKGEINKIKYWIFFLILEVFNQSPEARKKKYWIFLSDLVYLVCVAKHIEGWLKICTLFLVYL
jgi:hypothetical protein